jgi:hypothetical protein
MREIDLRDLAIVFWLNHPDMEPGAITRFDQLCDAISAIMEQPSAKTADVAWIRTLNEHLSMEEIRAIARRGGTAPSYAEAAPL